MVLFLKIEEYIEYEYLQQPVRRQTFPAVPKYF
ncbi:hypothetical protein GGR07_002316 [Bacteroides pyogenes]|nr:hypothetical protein [Bacteroides pyogenes]